ncbi:hypothetical protein [Austwickia chelonae]|nr:hypothetical protein [Austwickia chelonae]
MEEDSRHTGPLTKTISFWKVMVEDAQGARTSTGMTAQEWEIGLGKLRQRSLQERTVPASDGQLMGRPFLVEEEYAVALMSPRDETSWLAVLNQAGSDVDHETSELELAENQSLVETSVVTFIPGLNNIFGIVTGSQAAPKASAFALWLTKMFPPTDGSKYTFVADPCVSKKMREKLVRSDGVTSATVRVSTTQANVMRQAQNNLVRRLGEFMQTLQSSDELQVTVTLTVPPGQTPTKDEARNELRDHTRALLEIPGVDKLSAKVLSDHEDRRRREEINFINQKLSVKSLIMTRDDDGRLIKDDSAVRAIRSRATDEALLAELTAADRT